MPNVKSVPEGYHTITPYLVVTGAQKYVDFLKRAFNAQELYTMRKPDGSIGHCEYRIGNSNVMVGESRGDWKPTTAALYLYLDDCDTVYQRAIEAGAISVQEPADQFYGDRSGGVKDFAGNMWWIATHKEDVAPEELDRRAIAAYEKQQQKASQAASG
jgi:PhnB protein